ncbi:hypothetical protein MKW98_001196 [Papaver atlanticum]|uniref:Uncharacterized protein n=1 Tax=Papaver atlanticum TaxID=357466 RepID=A0AAD4SRK9_9MAGN|nr:hypothetical protein MKW98_001196 [Papaver atlanticum]
MSALVFHCQKFLVNDRINCGVHIFTPDILKEIRDVSSNRGDRGNRRSFICLQNTKVSYIGATYYRGTAVAVVVSVITSPLQLGTVLEQDS